MPIEILYTGPGVLRKFTGHIEFLDVLNANGEVWSHPQWDGFVYMIDDLRGISSTSFTRTDANLTGRMHIPAAASNPHLKVAAISTDPRILSLLAEFEPLLSEAGWEYKVFASPDEAMQWADSKAGEDDQTGT